MAGGVSSVLLSCVKLNVLKIYDIVLSRFYDFFTINEFNYSSSRSGCHLLLMESRVRSCNYWLIKTGSINNLFTGGQRCS